ncbi:MAG TPA: PKD domain-containing protein, partial [Methanoculleus sp.]|nr:PKD domain-containing protein [Methanoculleus sp.]
TWTDPADADFVKVMVYLDGAFRANVTAGVESYSATGLAPETSHEIGTRTVDASENINPAWANSTATTAAAESYPPTASFTFSPASPGTGDPIQFNDTSVDAGGTITAWAWEFGDGETADVQHPTHSYASSGFYQVNLTVTDDTAVTDTATASLFVHAAGPMTITVPDDFGTIQAAVNAAWDGDTVVVHSGTYPEQVVVNRSITLAGEGMPQVQASGGPGFAVTSPSCTLEGFAVTNGTYGIHVHADGARIEGNLLAANGIGILVLQADGTVLFNNTCENNSGGGMYLYNATGGKIFNNTCTGNADDGFPGIYLDDSSGNELYCNDLDNFYPSSGVYRNAAEAGGDSPSSNLWYNATLGMGNRYSDYYGVDDNGDGIGDSNYDIIEPEGGKINADLYPLMPTGPVIQPVPTFSGIAASNITNESATISWTIGNGVSSNNRVLYGTDSDLIGAVWSAWDNATTAPSIPLSSLLSNTTYHYRCYSERADDATRNATSGTKSFTTLERLPMVITVDDDDADVPGGKADFATITDALAASMDGDTILVYAGNYTGYHEVAARVNLTGIGWPEVSGDEDNTFDELGDVFALRADGCILDGFVIRDGWWHNQSGYGTTTDSAGVRIGYLSVGADDTIVRNNRIEDAKYGIIANTYSNNNTIRNNTINATYYGVWLNYARNTLFANNTVTNNYHWALHNTYRTSTTDNYATNNRIEYNTFDTDGWTPSGYDASYGREVKIVDTGGNILSHNTLLNQTYIRIQGDGNTIEENEVLGPCEYHFAGIDLSEDGNIVRNNTVRNHKFGIMLQTSTDNLQMSGNTISGCTYGFGFGGEIRYAGSRPSRNLIDTTNTVEGAPVYWIVGAAGEVYNSSTLAPAPGYLALIGCSDIRVEDFYLEKNAQSFLIHRSQNVTLDAVTAHGNAFQGVLIGDSSAITIRDSVTDSNGEDAVSGFHQAGIWATNTSSSRILDSIVTANNPSGIYFQYSCPDNLVAGSTVTNNGHSADSGGSFGIRNYESANSNLTVAGCTIGNTFAGRQGIGLANYGESSLFYNNKFFGHTVANAQNWGAGTRWNVTPSPGTNIIGGPWIAGNSWDDYAGEDLNGDGLGDTDLPYATGGGTPGGDHHPLLDTFVPDEVPPVIVIHAPAAGASYPAAAVPLEVSSPDADVAAWWYSLDAAANVTFIPNTTLPVMSTGAHTLRVFAADTSGNENSSSVTFTATVDVTPPALYVTSPEENATYAVYDVPLAVWSPDHDVFSWWYSLDGAANVTFTPNTTLPVPANGNHSVAVFVDDIIGNTNSTTVNFTVNATGPAPTPTPTPRIDTGDDSPEPPDYPLPVVEEPAFLITILTPDAGRTVDRQTEVTYSSTHPLARAYYQLDDGPHVQVSPGRGVPVGRLTLGTHEITVTGVDYFGRYGRGSVSFEVIPLAIGEREPVGTTAYPDDAAVAFTGRPVSYTLSFEVETGADEAVSVYLNRQLAGMPGSATTVVSSGSEPGALLQNVSPPSVGVWTRVTIPVPADRIVPGSENIISFIHTQNPARTEDLAAWHIRNVALVPDLPASAPSIRVLTPDQALGPGDEMMVWVEIAGVAPGDRFTAMVYLAAPDGTLISFPGGSGNPAPLNDAYVRGNHYGRLPGSLALTNTDLPGTYRLVATLEPEGAGAPVALSSAPVFFSTEPAVRLYLNRDMVSDGMPLRVTHAVTGGAVPPTEATLVITMERPDGTTEYLPSGTGTYASRHYAPLAPAYETVLDETVGGEWEDGTYVVRSMLYDRTDTLAAQDSVTFTVSRLEGTLTLSFPYSMDDGVAATSRIWLIDAVSLATVAEQETGTPHDEVAFSVPAGTYWYGGQMTTRTGDLMVMPVTPANRVSIGPGENVQRQVAVQPAGNAPRGEVIA